MAYWSTEEFGNITGRIINILFNTCIAVVHQNGEPDIIISSKSYLLGSVVY